MVVVFGLISCDKEDEKQSDCGDYAIVSMEDYDNADTSSFEISNVATEGSCITITIHSSGCDGNTWNAELVDLGDINESLPPQRSLRLILENNEVCNAYISKDFSFELEELSEGYDQVTFHLKDYDQSILVNF